MIQKVTRFFCLTLIAFISVAIVMTSHVASSSMLSFQKNHVLDTATEEQLAQNNRTGRISPIPNAAVVDSLHGSGIGIGIGVSSARNATINDVIEYNTLLLVPGSSDRSTGATLGFISQAQERILGHLAAAGFSRQDSEYYYPCSYAGTFAIGWKSTDDEGCPTVSFSRSGDPAQIGPKSQQNQPFNEKRIDRWVAPINLRHYCSTVADTGNAWSVKLSEKKWTEDEVEAVCSQALSECETLANGTCSIANRGDWRTLVPNDERNRPLRQVDLLLKCSGESFFHEKTLTREVHQVWKKMETNARSQNASACTFYVQYFDEVLISPTGDNYNLINTVDSDDGFVIYDLVGSVNIQPPGDPNITPPVRLDVGEKYIFRYSTNLGEKDDIPKSERKEIIDSSVIQAFLNNQNWVFPLKPEIDIYRKKLGDGFYRPPAVNVARINLDNGVSLLKATVNLDENVILTIDPARGVRTNNFNSFVQQRDASLILGGIYEGDWNIVSNGERVSPGGSQYTLLSIDAANRPEMITLTDAGAQARWSNYWFAVQAGPRLVRNGQATVNDNSARAEGHRTLDLATRTRRGAIGFSQDGKQLIYVMTAQGSRGVSIRELAEIMASPQIGAWQAMNLDGGDGPAIANEEDIVEPPGNGRDQSYFIVVYDASRAPASTQAAWDASKQGSSSNLSVE